MSAALPPLIGIGGRLASGKDTVADYLVEKHGFVKLGMSDPLLEAALALNPIINAGSFDSADSVFTVRFTEAVEDLGYTEAKKLPEVRRFLQVLGTEVGRQMIDENVWVDMAGRRIDKLRAEGRPVILTGVRFPNELELITGRGGQTWWVERFDPLVTTIALHASENGVRAEQFDAIIRNAGTLADLYEAVEKRASMWLPRRGVALTAAEALELEQALHADFPTVPPLHPRRRKARSMTNSTKITKKFKKNLALVEAFPDEVALDLSLEPQSGNLTPKQARKLAKLLISAADRAEHLGWEEDSDGNLKVVPC